jgi:dipeptidyl aminopeptidase/acylaminoacyl peptidase
MIDRRLLLAAGLAVPLLPGLARAQTTAQAAPKPPSLYEILREPAILDAALSPSGKDIAILGQRISDNDVRTTYVALLSGDDPTGPSRRIDLGDVDIEAIDWANDERLLVWVKKELKITTSGPRGSAKGSLVARRIVGINADGTRLAALFASDKRDFRGNLNLGLIVDRLPDDPVHMIMQAADYDNGVWALWKVDVYTGQAALVERGGDNTVGWYSQAGVPVLRYDVNGRGTVQSLMARAPGEADWTLLRRQRIDERGRVEFTAVASGDAPGVLLVAAQASGDETITVRSFDLKTRQFGSQVVRRPSHDVETVFTNRRDRMLAVAYVEDRVSYDFIDASLKGHYKAIEGFFERRCNVVLAQTDETANRLLLWVQGPREPGAWFFYDKAAKRLEPLGATREWLSEDRLAPMEVLAVTANDGQALTAYLTTPIVAPGGGGGARPLVVMPHGGPEERDSYGWDDWAQALAARGWLVLQPNFRGSAGYGDAFMQAGRRRWGERMQQDVEDCVAQVIASGRADPKRVAILGGSYGGYAALMGAVRRPDLYKAVVSIDGVSDLPVMLDWERDQEGAMSPVYEYWRAVIGDPSADQAQIEAASPRRHAELFTAPVLLIHGKDDPIVPAVQSRLMRDALKKAGKSVDLLEVEDMGHGPGTPQQSMTVLSRAIDFLAPVLGQ